jgi:Flp pilus assembly protein TadD
MALAALGSSRMEAQRGAATVEAMVDSWRARRAPARIVEALRMAKSGRVDEGTRMLLETVSRPMPETEYRSALPTLAFWLAHDQWTALALRARAELHFRAERVEPGIGDLTLALERDQSHAQWYQLLGTMFASAGRHDGALDAFRAASRLDPERGEYRADVAAECLRQGDLAGADAASQRAVELSPTDAPLGHVLRGAIAYLRDDLDGAEHAVSQVIERDPAHVGARIVKTAVLLRREQPEHAMAEIQAIINDGASPPALIALEGLALTRLGRKQDARAAFVSARGRSSDLVDLCERLARALDDEGFGGSAAYHRALAALLAG